MRVMLDTYVLVPALVSVHPRHSKSFECLLRAKQSDWDLCLSAHSLAECYSVLTRLPVKPPIKTVDANKLIRQSLVENASIICLSQDDYLMVIQDFANKGFSVGIIYDGLFYKAATIASVDYLFTWNHKDFDRIEKNPLFEIKTP